jgi:D-aminopeptidase
MLAVECVARSIARAIYEATPLPFPDALPSWRQRFAG